MTKLVISHVMPATERAHMLGRIAQQLTAMGRHEEAAPFAQEYNRLFDLIALQLNLLLDWVESQ